MVISQFLTLTLMMLQVYVYKKLSNKGYYIANSYVILQMTSLYAMQLFFFFGGGGGIYKSMGQNDTFFFFSDAYMHVCACVHVHACMSLYCPTNST